MERWIKLRLHRNHAKVLDLAELMNADRDHVLAMSIEWFRHLDSRPTASKRGYTPAMINSIVGAEGVDFAAAIERIGWIRKPKNSDRFVPKKFDKYFSDAARRSKYRSKTAKSRAGQKPGERPARSDQIRSDQIRSES